MCPIGKSHLHGLNLSPDIEKAVLGVIHREWSAMLFTEAGELLHRKLIRLDRDSSHGRALARVLGVTNGQSIERAAVDFGVTRQYLHALQAEMRKKLGTLIAPLSAAAQDDDEEIQRAEPCPDSDTNGDDDDRNRLQDVVPEDNASDDDD